MTTATVVLEYCGGARTDSLVERLRAWNPGRIIDVLDNASPHSRCKYITHQNPRNSYVGGGIVDCFNLAAARACDNLFFVANDIEPASPIVIDEFEAALAADPALVQLGAAITEDSTPQAVAYPWMLRNPSQPWHRVPHADLLCCIVRTSFLQSFDGFPPSRGGWGYDWELAHQALNQGRKIAIANWCSVRHKDKPMDQEAATSQLSKQREMFAAYRHRYPRYEFGINFTVAEYWKRNMIQFVEK